jgi:hypothetical protein
MEVVVPEMEGLLGLVLPGNGRLCIPEELIDHRGPLRHNWFLSVWVDVEKDSISYIIFYFLSILLAV